MTIINIGTTKKNLIGVKIDKPFKDITVGDLYSIVEEQVGPGVRIIGWADVTDKSKQDGED